MSDSISTNTAGQPAARPSSRGAGVGVLGRASGRYAATLLILVGAAVGLIVLSHLADVYLRKEAVPLQRSLRDFDFRRLAPEYERHPVVPQPISSDMLQTLGTDEYADLRLVRTDLPPEDRTSMAIVFINYFTGKPDLVPHVPDECMVAGGFDRVGVRYTAKVHATGIGAENDEAPVRVIQFSSRGGVTPGANPTTPLTVMYFFHCNNQYAATRTGVRRVLGRLFDRYAYYAKIEVRFVSRAGEPATLEESLAAIGPLMQKLMPVLFEDHFADWEALTAGTAVDEEG